jgi:hypothetical protein
MAKQENFGLAYPIPSIVIGSPLGKKYLEDDYEYNKYYHGSVIF